ncbi:MAG TPA: GGDEF domain-containing protein, partial [Myxococcales bacterium]
VFAVMLLGMRRLYPQVRGAGSIALGFALASPATLLLATRSVLPHLISVVGGNELAIVSYLFLYRGILRFLATDGYHSPAESEKDCLPLYVVAALTTGVLLYSTEIHELPALRILVTTFSFALARILIARRLLRASAGRPHLLLFAMSLLGFALLTIGDAVFLTLHGVPQDFLTRGRLQVFTLLLSVLFVCSNGIFYLAMFGNAIAEQIQAQARLDFLTGTFNREGIQRALTMEIACHRRKHRPLSVLLIDLDEFKGINDSHGHAAGDDALLTVARTIQSVVREYDKLGRFGGDEFLLLLPETTAALALQTAARIRETLAAQPASAHALARLTLSIGVTQWVESDDIASLLQRADRALYQTKRGGRDGARLAIPGEELEPKKHRVPDTPLSTHRVEHVSAAHTAPLPETYSQRRAAGA